VLLEGLAKDEDVVKVTGAEVVEVFMQGAVNI
jgi:hypothetical protein